MLANLFFYMELLICIEQVVCQTQSVLKPPFMPISIIGKYKSCDDLYQRGYRQSGVYPIYPGCSSSPKFVLCYMTNEYAGTVILYRYNGLESFEKSFREYQVGFGSVDRDYWLGLECIYELTAKDGHTKLTVVMEDWSGNTVAMHYPYFKIGSSSDDYRLDVSAGFFGPDGRFNHIYESKGQPFQTKDHYRGDRSYCAFYIKAGWWFRSDICTNALPTGRYYRSSYNSGYYTPRNSADPRYDDGVFWRAWRGGRYSVRYVTMALSTM